MKNDLHLKSLKRSLQFIPFPTKLYKRDFSEVRVCWHRLATQQLDNIVFSDEKLFTIEEATNKQTHDLILAPTSLSIPKSIFMSCGLRNHSQWWLGRNLSKRPHSFETFVPVGVKMFNSTIYQKLILDPVVKHQNTSMHQQILPFLFQQNGAPSNTHRISPKVGYVKIFCGFHVQGGMASRFESHKFLNLVHPGDKSLSKATFKCWSSEEVSSPWVGKIPQNTLRAAVEAFPERLKKVVGVKGGYIWVV